MTFLTVALISCIGVLELSIIPAWRGITAGTPLRNKLLDLSLAGMEYSAPLTAPYNRLLAETRCNNIWLDMWEGEKKANIVLAAFNLAQLIPQDYEATKEQFTHFKMIFSPSNLSKLPWLYFFCETRRYLEQIVQSALFLTMKENGDHNCQARFI